jgi:hypothetical protein
MNCHSCSHSEAILRGDYDSTPWDELPCSSCKLRENTFYTVPYDDEHPPEEAIDLAGDAPEEPILFPSDVVTQFVQGFLSLPPEQRDVISWRYQGLQYKEIAERQGITVQLAEMRHKCAMKNWPALESLFPYKMARRRVRRPHR